MSDLVLRTIDRDIGIITVNNPPVNALSPGVPEGILEAVEAFGKDPAVRAIVLIGGGRTFIAGADIKEFGKITSGQKRDLGGIRLMLLAIERLPQAGGRGHPRHRVRRRPGDGDGLPLPRRRCRRPRSASRRSSSGSSRAPAARSGCRGWPASPRRRRCAPAASPIRRAEALQVGILDRVIDGDLLQGAVAFAREVAAKGGPPRKTRDLTDQAQRPGGQCRGAGRQCATRSRNAPAALLAPLKAIEAVEAATHAAVRRGHQEGGRAVPANACSPTSRRR